MPADGGDAEDAGASDAGSADAGCVSKPEVCDGFDNDCDGLVDADDDLGGDPSIGVTCYGDPDGICSTPQHAGATDCEQGAVVCRGPNLLVEDQVPELCNGQDDDCDGAIDDSPTDVGQACGATSPFPPCQPGTVVCLSGAHTCEGAVGPAQEVCNNGVDDDCDGLVDQDDVSDCP